MKHARELVPGKKSAHAHTATASRAAGRPCRGAIALLAGASLLAGCGKRSAQPADSQGAGATSTPPVEAAAPARAARSGEQIYEQYCAVCHMADGSGVPNFQPPLVNNAIVSGDPARLEAVIRAGSAALADRESEYDAEMPPFGNLTDAEVKAVVAYVRERFGTPADDAEP